MSRLLRWNRLLILEMFFWCLMLTYGFFLKQYISKLHKFDPWKVHTMIWLSAFQWRDLGLVAAKPQIVCCCESDCHTGGPSTKGVEQSLYNFCMQKSYLFPRHFYSWKGGTHASHFDCLITLWLDCQGFFFIHMDRLPRSQYRITMNYADFNMDTQY